MRRLGRAVAGRFTQTALHDLQDYVLNRIAQLRGESQATFSGNCCRRPIPVFTRVVARAGAPSLDARLAPQIICGRDIVDHQFTD